jgi:hypothetical protein
MIDERAVLLDRRRGVLGSRAKEKLLGRKLTRQTAPAGSLLRGRRRYERVLVRRGQRVLAVLEHAQERQHLLTQPLVLVDDAAEILAQVPQLRLGRVYALVAGLHDADNLGEVVLGGRRLLRRRVRSCCS